MSCPKKYLPPREASEFLKEEFGIQRTYNTLGKDRCHGGGPDFVRFGRMILYPVESLRAWGEKRLSGLMSSTSDPAANPHPIAAAPAAQYEPAATPIPLAASSEE